MVFLESHRKYLMSFNQTKAITVNDSGVYSAKFFFIIWKSYFRGAQRDILCEGQKRI